jgi:hypothetical protein
MIVGRHRLKLIIFNFIPRYTQGNRTPPSPPLKKSCPQGGQLLLLIRKIFHPADKPFSFIAVISCCMKRLLFFIAFIFSLHINTQAQLMPSTVREVYDFAVGDTFQYRHYSFSSGAGLDVTSYRFIIITGKSVSLNNDSIFYNYKEVGKQTYYGSMTGYTTGYYIYNNQLLTYTNLDSFIIPDPINFNCALVCDTTFSAPYCPQNMCYDSVYYSNYWYDSSKINRQERADFEYASDIMYVNGLGIVKDYEASEGYQNDIELIYYHKANGELWGIAHYFVIVGIEEKQTINASIFPNPATSQIEISLPADAVTKYQSLQFQLYEITGRAVQSQIITSEKTLFTITHLPQGIYYWRLVSASHTLQQGKLAKQ